MKVVHIGPFAPWEAGIYEAARDMARADMLQGHDVAFVDSGKHIVGRPQPEPPLVGAVDERATWTLTTEGPEAIRDADVLVMHTGCDMAWLESSAAPVVWMIHATPASAAQAEMAGLFPSYSSVGVVAGWARTKAVVWFWPEFTPFWSLLVPRGKQVVFDFPPVDRAAFGPAGERFEIPAGQHGEINGLIADSYRSDSRTLELLHGAVMAADRIQGLKWHIVGLPDELGPLEVPLKALKAMGALGKLGGRIKHVDRAYRAVDFVLSGRRSVSRVIAEALCCGTPVIAADGCKAANCTADFDEPGSVARAVEWLTDGLADEADVLQQETAELAERFDLERYGKAMSELYARVIKEG